MIDTFTDIMTLASKLDSASSLENHNRFTSFRTMPMFEFTRTCGVIIEILHINPDGKRKKLGKQILMHNSNEGLAGEIIEIIYDLHKMMDYEIAKLDSDIVIDS